MIISNIKMYFYPKENEIKSNNTLGIFSGIDGVLFR